MSALRRGAAGRVAARVIRLRPLVFRSESMAAPAEPGEALDRWIGPCYRVEAWMPATPGRWSAAGWVRRWVKAHDWLATRLYPETVTRSAAPDPVSRTSPQ